MLSAKRILELRESVQLVRVYFQQQTGDAGRLSLPGSMFWQIVFLMAAGKALLCVLLIELAGAISSILVFFFGS